MVEFTTPDRDEIIETHKKSLLGISYQLILFRRAGKMINNWLRSQYNLIISLFYSRGTSNQETRHHRLLAVNCDKRNGQPPAKEVIEITRHYIHSEEYTIQFLPQLVCKTLPARLVVPKWSSWASPCWSTYPFYLCSQMHWPWGEGVGVSWVLKKYHFAEE